jgi:hypothetical protein
VDAIAAVGGSHQRTPRRFEIPELVVSDLHSIGAGLGGWREQKVPPRNAWAVGHQKIREGGESRLEFSRRYGNPLESNEFRAIEDQLYGFVSM